MAVIRKKSEGDCTFKAGLKRRNTWVCQPCRVSGLLEPIVSRDKRTAWFFEIQSYWPNPRLLKIYSCKSHLPLNSTARVKK